jgi:hypothetical protein
MARSDLPYLLLREGETQKDFALDSFQVLAFAPIVAMARVVNDYENYKDEDHYAMCNILTEYIEAVDAFLKQVISGKGELTVATR